MSNQQEVVIVGGGFSGLLCGYFLKEAGIEDFCILEMGASLGGVWQKGSAATPEQRAMCRHMPTCPF